MLNVIGAFICGYAAGALTLMLYTSPDTVVCRHIFNMPETADVRYHDNKCWIYTDSETELKR